MKSTLRFHPELKKNGEGRAKMVGESAGLRNDDKVASAFLAFLARDFAKHPSRSTRLSKATLARAVLLTKNVTVDDSEILPPDVTI